MQKLKQRPQVFSVADVFLKVLDDLVALIKGVLKSIFRGGGGR